MDAQAPLHGYPRPGYFHAASLGLLIFLPTALFMIALSFMTFLFYRVPALVWLVICVMLGLSLMFMVVRPARDGPKYWFNLGVVCFMAVCVGTTAGFLNYERNMDKYFAYQGQRAYDNVGPTEPALQHLDAGKIVFTTDAVVDVQNVYVSEAAKSYCVAPIVREDAAGKQSVQFWAAGLDCCQPGSNFTCDDAADSTAHAGLVYLDGLSYPEYDMGKFRDAAKATMDAKGLNGARPQDALFVKWVKDVDMAHQDYWYTAANFVVMGLCVFAIFATVVGFTIHFSARRVPAKSKIEARSYGGAR